MHIPLAVLNQISAEGFDWQIPGLREELVTALLKSLPKTLRRNFVPAPDFAKAALARMSGDRGGLLAQLQEQLRAMTGVTVPADAWDHERLPDHLKMTFRVVDGEGNRLGESEDLEQLRRELKPDLRAEISAAADDLERSGLREWELGSLPRTFEQERSGHPVRAYPALVDEGDSVAVRTFDTEREQQQAMVRGTRRMLLLQLPSPLKSLQRGLGSSAKLVLANNPDGGLDALLADCADCAVDKLVDAAGGPAWDDGAFTALREEVGRRLGPTTADTASKVEAVLAVWQRVETALADRSRGFPGDAFDDIRAQLDSLLYPGFVAGTGWDRLPDLVRYLRAVEQRIDKARQQPQRDRDWMSQVHEVDDRYRDLRSRVPEGQAPSTALQRIGWMIEEFRVSLFAQSVGTAHPVSAKRIHRSMDKAAG